MSKILMIVGSDRKRSFNAQLAREIVKEIGDRAETEFLDFSNIPFINQDEEFPAPESVEEARKAFKEADGVWLVTPQYNASYPGRVKNLLDWISRGTEKGVRESAISYGVKFTVSSAAGGVREGVLPKAVELGKFTGMDVMDEPIAAVPLSAESWQTDTLILSDDDREAIAGQVSAFLDFIR